MQRQRPQRAPGAELVLPPGHRIAKRQALRQQHQGARKITFRRIIHHRVQTITLQPQSQGRHMHTQLVALATDGLEQITRPVLVVLQQLHLRKAVGRAVDFLHANEVLAFCHAARMFAREGNRGIPRCNRFIGLCTVLSRFGYTGHAVHDNDGTFYDRHIVFPNLGFDTFTPIEYMNGIEYNPTDWPDDSVLTDVIMDALASTNGPDFVYTITVQAHGKYPRERIEWFDYGFSAEGFESEEEKNAFEYYLSQLHETDAFIGELIEELSVFKEPVIAVFFGDHLPEFDLTDEDLTTGSLFKTEYAVWSNRKLEARDRNLTAYRLGSWILENAGFNAGILPRLHRHFSGFGNYQSMLSVTEYDMLYGDGEICRAVYGPDGGLEPSRMRMGVAPVALDGVSFTGGALIASGHGFTLNSVIKVDGREMETLFINEGTLACALDEMPEGMSVTVAQIGNSIVLSETEIVVTQ